MVRAVDLELEAEARAWIESVLQRDLGEGSFQEVLKDGTALCEYAALKAPARSRASMRARVEVHVLTRAHCPSG